LQNQKKPEITIPKPPSASNQNTNAAGLEENNTNSKPENRASHPQSGIETEIPSQPEAKQEVKQDVLPEVPESSHHETEKVSDSEPPKPLDSENLLQKSLHRKALQCLPTDIIRQPNHSAKLFLLLRQKRL
jgi:hypothetical protein